MRALVVYESMYGNTHAVATNIAAGLSARYEVTLVPVARATTKLVAAADLIVVGGPTHMHGMSSAASRRMAVQAASKQGSELTLDPDADSAGLHALLDGLGAGRALAAAFDTRFRGAAAFTGRASHGIGRLLRRHGYRLVLPPESFLVTNANTLVDGEATRARSWGAVIGLTASEMLARHA
jgi:Flavodoxin